MTSFTGLLILEYVRGKGGAILRYETRNCKHRIASPAPALEKNTPALFYYRRQQIRPPAGTRAPPQEITIRRVE